METAEGVLVRRTGTSRLRVVAVALTPTQSGMIALARSELAKKPSASLAQQMVAAATSFPSATATRPTYSAPIPMAAENAAAVGGRTSVSCPPMIQGLDEAAVTEADSMINSRAVSCGRWPARLSSSCMSCSRLDRAAQTWSFRFELELITRLFWLSKTPLLVDGGDDASSFRPRASLLVLLMVLLPLIPALPSLSLPGTGFIRSRVRPRNLDLSVPSMESPVFVSTEVSVDSETVAARNWTCRSAASPAVAGQEGNSFPAVVVACLLLLLILSLLILLILFMAFEEKTGPELNDKDDTPGSFPKLVEQSTAVAATAIKNR
mmetsp:Transcript_16073/g.34833  ORF Transcript_16073/g.34833 Transcript_16073/m.34833 type:complete len:321 (+) Transcript_16073:1028-1990(+)